MAMPDLRLGGLAQSEAWYQAKLSTMDEVRAEKPRTALRAKHQLDDQRMSYTQEALSEPGFVGNYSLI